MDNQAFKMAAAWGVLDENIQYSDYFAGLEGPTKSRYKEKITVCVFDPYALRKSDFSENIELLPNVQYPDIVNYLVLQTSWATKTQMKAYKSMDAYNFFVSGWVNTLCLRSVDTDKVLVFARVGNVTFLSDIKSLRENIKGLNFLSTSAYAIDLLADLNTAAAIS